jgi:hypothetical protein
MITDSQQFFRDIIAAGAIIAGFCGTFLAFRIQREASYYRQPHLDRKEGAIDIYIGLTQFNSSFLLIILAALSAIVCGFLIPLFGLSGKVWWFVTPWFAVSGLLSALVLLAGYFLDELVHYEIIWKKWRPATSGWRRECPIVAITLLVAAAAFAVTYLLFRQEA